LITAEPGDPLGNKADNIESPVIQTLHQAAESSQETALVAACAKKPDANPLAGPSVRSVLRKRECKQAGELLLEPPVADSVMDQLKGRHKPVVQSSPPVEWQRQVQRSIELRLKIGTVFGNCLFRLEHYRAKAQVAIPPHGPIRSTLGSPL
jgi:hypothetical protein